MHTFSPGASGLGSAVDRDRDDAGLGREEVPARGLDLPQRPQTERVDGEHVLVAEARDQGDRPLRERAERLAQVHVEAAQVGGQALDLVDDRRQRQLQRLDQRQAVAVDQRLDDAAEVLGVRPVGLDRHPEHARLLAQARDRVDLAVVTEHAERLHALEAGPGVGGVAVVPEQGDGLGARIVKVRVVAPENGRRPEHLVDGTGRRAGGHVHVQALLELQRQVEALRRVLDQAAHLPEHRLLLAGVGPERRGVDRVLALSQHAQADLAHQVARLLLHRRGAAALARDEHVHDREPRVQRELRRVPAGADLLRPDLARDVDQDPATVALPVHVAGPVKHLLERREGVLDRVVAGLRALVHHGVDAAGILVLHRLGRPEGTIGLHGREALRDGVLHGPPRVPRLSPSGRATSERARQFTAVSGRAR